MRSTRLIAAAAASLFLLGGCSAPKKEHIKEPVEPVANEIPSDITITGEEMNGNEWYHEMCDEILQFKSSCIVSTHVTNQDVKKALAHLPSDHPEIFWLGKRYSASTVTDGSKIALGFLEGLEEEDIPDMAAKLDEKVNEIVANTPSGSDYDKILYVHDYIVDNTTYDYAGAASDKPGLYHTTYGCLVDGSAVCEGYAESFTLIMNKLGIESGICTGSNHAWNYVKLNGKYYWIDTTWDDHAKHEPEHIYCLVNSDMLMRSRNIDWTQGYFPDCTSTDDNYYVKNGSYFTEYDRDKVISYIESCAGKEHCEFMFADYETYKTALYDLFDDNKISKASNIDSDSVDYFREDNMFAVVIYF
ncbi:MAG: hypothetical protein MJ079_03175 [Ruminococcus sp.]|nr:hypothetical protein [Ruminococcus sp.]